MKRFGEDSSTEKTIFGNTRMCGVTGTALVVSISAASAAAADDDNNNIRGKYLNN